MKHRFCAAALAAVLLLSAAPLSPAARGTYPRDLGPKPWVSSSDRGSFTKL